jgi:hypothetical protein
MMTQLVYNRFRLTQPLKRVIPNQLTTATDLALIPSPSPQGEGSQFQSPSPVGEGFRVRAYL